MNKLINVLQKLTKYYSSYYWMITENSITVKLSYKVGNEFKEDVYMKSNTEKHIEQLTESLKRLERKKRLSEKKKQDKACIG
ncbi:gp277 [Sphingomonas phage PAU]|uniref:gp277 n=1 Tax=Sphingomonas phage PAU TaxID=1150991 RepID=UPI0002573494|nr:gp277 [Sphingomonas phage PAU]AFF28275.1 gp277 [Sphingomonas phage PAU]